MVYSYLCDYHNIIKSIIIDCTYYNIITNSIMHEEKDR